MTNRLAYRIVYSAMVFALAAACTPGGETDGASAPAGPEQPPIAAAPATEPATSADPNTTDTLATATPADPAAATTADAPGAAAPAAQAATPAELANGAGAYARTCAMCHGSKGEGSPAGSAIATKDVGVIAAKITNGQVNPGDKMPPMGSMMSADDIDDVAKWVAAGFPAQ